MKFYFILYIIFTQNEKLYNSAKIVHWEAKNNVSQCIVHCVQNKAPNETISSETKKNSLQYILIHFFLFPFLSSLNFYAYSFSLGQSLSFPIKVTSRQEVRFAKIRSTFWDAGGGGPNFTSLLLFVCMGERVGADVGGCLTTR